MLVSSGRHLAPQRVYKTNLEKQSPVMFGLPFFLRFLLWSGAGVTVLSMANSKKDVALLTAVFLLGLGALETVLALIGA